MRALRLRKKMGLVELGQHTGLSPALLSKIERGKMFPTLPTLLSVALVFSVGLDYFFGGGQKRPALAVVRAADRMSFPNRAGARRPAYRFECLDYPVTERLLNAYFVRVRGCRRGAGRTAPARRRRDRLRDGRVTRDHGRHRGTRAARGRLDLLRPVARRTAIAEWERGRARRRRDYRVRPATSGSGSGLGSGFGFWFLSSVFYLLSSISF